MATFEVVAEAVQDAAGHQNHASLPVGHLFFPFPLLFHVSARLFTSFSISNLTILVLWELVSSDLLLSATGVTLNDISCT